ncbi:hypothetical protein EIP91_002997 [Steccherinum ochraceum]|uniref:Uncharacterized protein n=1 Tax=Steccherinum ochraceum TaxID=92696 RepID=A0A4R0RHE7_9APHY|nr:hypothetical protein EIP91_002997 [Steccherinum ochraceum]
MFSMETDTLFYILLAAVLIFNLSRPDRDHPPSKHNRSSTTDKHIETHSSQLPPTDFSLIGIKTKEEESTKRIKSAPCKPASTSRRNANEVVSPSSGSDRTSTAVVQDPDDEECRSPFFFASSRELFAGPDISPRIMLEIEPDQWARSVYQLLPSCKTDKTPDDGRIEPATDCDHPSAQGNSSYDLSHLAAEDNDRTAVAEVEDKDVSEENTLTYSASFSEALEDCMLRFQKLSVDDPDAGSALSLVSPYGSPVARSLTVADFAGQDKVPVPVSEETEKSDIDNENVSQAKSSPSEPTTAVSTSSEPTSSGAAVQQPQPCEEPKLVPTAETDPPSTTPRPVIVKRFLNNLIANNKSHNDRRPPSGLPSRLNPATHKSESRSAAPLTSKHRGGRHGRGNRSATPAAAAGSCDGVGPQSPAAEAEPPTSPCLPPRVTRSQRIQAVQSCAANPASGPPLGSSRLSVASVAGLFSFFDFGAGHLFYVLNIILHKMLAISTLALAVAASVGLSLGAPYNFGSACDAPRPQHPIGWEGIDPVSICARTTEDSTPIVPKIPFYLKDDESGASGGIMLGPGPVKLSSPNARQYSEVSSREGLDARTALRARDGLMSAPSLRGRPVPLHVLT